MKNLIFIFLFFGIATLYIGCSDNNPSAPVLNPNEQVTTTLDKKIPNYFEGTSLTVAVVDLGKTINWPKTEPYQRVQTRGLVVQTDDVLDDARVTGIVTWVVNMNEFYTEGGEFINDKRWGTGELIIPDVGKWDMNYKGWANPDSVIYEVDGHGKGEFRGLKAHWRYYKAYGPGPFAVKGYIIEHE